MIKLGELYIDGTHEDERGHLAVICGTGIDGNIADVYGETQDDAIETAEYFIKLSNQDRGHSRNILLPLWFDTESHLPDDNERVLVFHTRHQIMYHHNGVWYSDRGTTYGTTYSVRFWMPLPNQPSN